MTWWGRVKDLPQAEGCEKPKAERPKQGHKEPQKQPEKERKVGENKKPKKRKQKTREKTDLNPGGWGRKRQRGT